MAKNKTSSMRPTEDPQPIARGLVSRLYDDILHERCVVFLGAGSTTERASHGRRSFYEHIRESSSYPSGSPALSFPDLMQYFCEHRDGGRHNRLIREALSHIQVFCVSGENNSDATMFTDSLAEIPYLNRFVTTNWDPFLERSLDVLVPMVEDRDLAFWDDHKRQVLKIHGCITRPYSLVATQDDYDKCLDRNPLIFNKLKDLMATKTFLFTGYSMRDADFQKIWGGIVNSLGQLTKMAYALDPKATDDQIAFWKERGIQILRVTDIMFIRVLRERLVKEDLIPSEQFLSFMQRQRRRIVSIHINNRQVSVGQFASAMYQDGLLHELEDVLTSAALGTKMKVDFESDLRDSEKALDLMKLGSNPIETAYRSGRLEIIKRFTARDARTIPAYFHPYKDRPTAKLINGDKLRRL